MPPIAVAEKAQLTLWLEGRPFSLADRPYLLPIYESHESYNGTNMVYTVLQTGRQVEKTTTVAALQVLFLQERPYRHTLYAAPRPHHVRVFSNHRFKQLLIESPSLRNLMRGKYVRDQVHDRVLSNMSKAYFRTAFLDAEQARGLTIDLLAIDELQGILRDHIAIIEQCQSHRPFGNKIYAGTPLSFDNPLTEHWKMSTQKEWIVKCSAEHSNQLGMKNIGKIGPICGRKACGKPINIRDGRWVAAVKTAPYDGYHISQLMVPWYQAVHPRTGKRAWEKILLALSSYSEAQFRNEVLGEAFRAGGSVITEDDFYACCGDYRITHVREKTIRGQTPLYLGVDWGGYGRSRTAVCIGCYTDGKFTVLDSYFFDGRAPETELEEIARIVNKWRISLVLADEGNGQLNNRLLRRKVSPSKVFGCHLSGTSGVVMKYLQGQMRFVANRTESMNYMFAAIRERRIRFPRKEDIEPFVKDVTSIYEEYNPKSRKIVYDHKPDETDDWAHALNLAHLAFLTHTQKIPFRTSKN